jgi:UPF0755 protein
VIRRLAVWGLALLLVLGAGGAWALRRALAPVSDADAQNVVFEVAPGAPLSRIARELEARELVRSARAVEWLARARGLATELRSGEYVLSASMAPREILERISRGEVATYAVVLPEGLRAREIAERLEAGGVTQAEAFMGVVADPDFVASLGLEGESLEGYLFPETYRFPRGLAPQEVARSMVSEFRGVWRELEPQARRLDFSMRDVVTLASIVEKETGAAEERPLIASVFHNRLRKGMRLESDPTVIYGIPDFDGNLRRVHLEDTDNPYNTYRIAGLPPGPIANPGADALRAVVQPADTEYLYFVSRNDGTHRFSKTYREHANAVNRYQRRQR